MVVCTLHRLKHFCPLINEFYPENPTNTKMSFNKKILVEIESKQIPQLRANLNSTLRLTQASIDSIDSVNT